MLVEQEEQQNICYRKFLYRIAYVCLLDGEEAQNALAEANVWRHYRHTHLEEVDEEQMACKVISICKEQLHFGWSEDGWESEELEMELPYAITGINLHNLLQLELEERLTMYLFYCEGMSINEIATLQVYTDEEVMEYLHRGREHLQQLEKWQKYVKGGIYMQVQGLGGMNVMSKGNLGRQSGGDDGTYSYSWVAEHLKKDVFEQSDSREENIYNFYEALLIKNSKVIPKQEVSVLELGAVTVTPMRGLTYEECDYVQARVLQGCTYRAKVDIFNKQVYVEYQNDEGGARAYLVNVDKLPQITKDPVISTALAAWKKVMQEQRVSDVTVAGSEKLDEKLLGRESEFS